MRIGLVVVALTVVGCNADTAPPDPSALARAAYDDALATGIDYEMLDRDGRVLSSMRGNVMRAGDIVATVNGDHMTFEDGTTVEVPGARGDPAQSLAPLLRPARYDGNALVLEGSPPARAWLRPDGKLERLEVDLPDDQRLVVTRQRH